MKLQFPVDIRPEGWQLINQKRYQYCTMRGNNIISKFLSRWLLADYYERFNHRDRASRWLVQEIPKHFDLFCSVFRKPNLIITCCNKLSKIKISISHFQHTIQQNKQEHRPASENQQSISCVIIYFDAIRYLFLQTTGNLNWHLQWCTDSLVTDDNMVIFVYYSMSILKVILHTLYYFLFEKFM